MNTTLRSILLAALAARAGAKLTPPMAATTQKKLHAGPKKANAPLAWHVRPHRVAVAQRAAAAADPGKAERRAAWRRSGAFALTYLAYCAIYLARKPVSVVKPVLRRELQLSTSQLGGIDTAWLAAYAAGQLLLGRATQAFAPASLLPLAFVLSGAATALISLANNAAQFATCWDLYPAAQRASMVGAWQTSQQVGGVAANFFAAHTLQQNGWRAIFATAGLTVSAAALPLGLLLRHAPKKSVNAPRMPPPLKTRLLEDKERPASSLRGVISVCVSYFCVKMARYSLMFWLPLFLVDAAGVDAPAAARLATLLDVGGAAGSLFVGVVADKVCGGALLKACAPLALLTSLLLAVHAFAYHKGPVINAVLMLAVGFCVAAPDGVLGGAAARNLCEYNDASPLLAPKLSGLINGCGSVGAIVQGYGTARLVETVGWKGFFVTLSGLMALATAALVPALRLEQEAKLAQRPQGHTM